MSFIVTAALAAAASNMPARAPSTTLQQDFDAASAAEAAGDCTRAVPLFEALERRPGVKPGSLSASTIAVRKGKCLIQLGRTEEGENAIVADLPGLERAGSAFNIDVTMAYQALGDVALSRFDYGQAKERYGKARAIAVPQLQMKLLAGLIKASVFDAGPEPLAYADEGLRLAATQQPSKDNLAVFHTLKARVLLNRGETEAAYADLKKALDLSGGLTMRTTLSEASMRGDLALAAMLLNRKDDARRYLAYTGAGRIEASPFATAVSMSAPDCGEETGLRPEDFAVVEFGISADGSVGSAHTIYSRGGPTVAAAFARAVKDWYWRPEELAKIPLFYRVATRVELRCTTAGGPAPSVTKPLAERFSQWALPLLGLLDTSDQIALIAALRRKVADTQSQDAAAQVAAAGILGFVDPRTNADTVAMLDRAIALTGSTSVSPEIVNTLRILRVLSSPFAKIRGSNARLGRFDKQSIVTLLQDPVVANDPIAANTLRLLADPRASGLVREAAEDRRLSDHHPLRQLALLILANQAASTGDLTRAQELFARTGLSEQQCALIGPKPALRRTGASSNDFPMEAMRYGFEGWVRLEFDITADGRTANARPVIAYPPFVFVDAAKGMTRDIRYQASYRPDGGMACSANGETIRFVLP